MSKRRLFNTIKRKIGGIFREKREESKEWKEKMRQELEKMARLNGELILMMK